MYINLPHTLFACRLYLRGVVSLSNQHTTGSIVVTTDTLHVVGTIDVLSNWVQGTTISSGIIDHTHTTYSVFDIGDRIGEE